MTFDFWHQRAGRLHVDQPRRYSYVPYGELDFLMLPVPIYDFVAGPIGVTFQCEDGVYHLSGDPNDQTNSWRVEKVWRR